MNGGCRRAIILSLEVHVFFHVFACAFGKIYDTGG